jgi:KaiC/GvpD/RAD55 family RecA-like ATPase
MTIRFENIPSELRERQQWVLWTQITRDDKPTKVPFQIGGKPAKADDPSTWNTFENVISAYHRGGYTGIGYEFSADDEFCGVDLDGCYDPIAKKCADWAREIIALLGTYAEMSPSQTGVKLFLRAKSPFARGRKCELPDMPRVSDKTPAIEVYDHGRYFAVTGWLLAGQSRICEARQDQLDEIVAKYFANEPTSDHEAPTLDFRSEGAIIERARKYIAKIPPAVSGQNGHGQTFHVACVLVCGFCLSEADAMTLMREYNGTCQPAWSERELEHKVRSAAKQPGERGYLRTTSPSRWQSIQVPTYDESAPSAGPRITTLADAARSYLDSLQTGQSLIETGIGDLDYALGGGIERGELVIFAARPSHGKSAVALQCVHAWTNQGMPCAIISEEMSAIALGKRTLQFLTAAPQEHWRGLSDQLGREIDAYAATRAPAIVLEGCGDASTAVASIEAAIARHKVECVVVDYAQLLRGTGKTRYEQMTQVSVTLRQLASKHRLIVLALCQMNRDIESRSTFKPTMSDIRETGQFEQDADVIVFLCWPYRIDQTAPQSRYQFFVEKNRNRPINQRMVDCSFNPSRQTVSAPQVECPFEQEQPAWQQQ